MNVSVKLVRTVTEDDLILNGIYYQGDKTKDAIIFIHGFVTDFYSHDFYDVMGEYISKNDNAFVFAQTRGTGLKTEFITKDYDGKYIGSMYEKLEDAHLDISAWIEYLGDEGYENIILMGHSLGTIKVVRYMEEGKYKDRIKKLILLAPFDKNGYIEHMTKGKWKENNKVALEMINNGKGEETIPDTYDDYPISYQTYYSWYIERDLNSIWDFYRKEYNSPVLNRLSIPVKVIVGDIDEFLIIPELGTTVDDAVEYINRNIKDIDISILKGCKHLYRGFENKMSELITNFINQ